MMSWDTKAISGYTTYPFEEETNHSKIPQVLLGKLSQLNISFEKYMPGTTKKMEKWFQLIMNIEKEIKVRLFWIT